MADVLQMNRCSETLRAKYNLSSRREKAIQRFQLVWYQCPGLTLSKIPLEPLLKVILSAIGMLIEVPPSPFNNLAKLFDEQEGERIIAKNLRNCKNALMYGFFCLSGIVDLVM